MNFSISEAGLVQEMYNIVYFFRVVWYACQRLIWLDLKILQVAPSSYFTPLWSLAPDNAALLYVENFDLQTGLKSFPCCLADEVIGNSSVHLISTSDRSCTGLTISFLEKVRAVFQSSTIRPLLFNNEETYFVPAVFCWLSPWQKWVQGHTFCKLIYFLKLLATPSSLS